MKIPIAITLIIMGALFIMVPAVSDYLFQLNIVNLMTQTKASTVNLDGKMDDLYRIGCWMTGSAMVGVAVLCSLFAGRETARHGTLAANPA